MRQRSDVRTLVWALLAPLVMVASYVRPEWLAVTVPLSCALGLIGAVVAHNHNHCPTFRTRGLNQAFGAYISLFNGYPTFAWIPTHNLNHHKLVNKAGDATITWRYTNDNTWWMVAIFFFISSYFQGGPINTYIRKARNGNRSLFRVIVSQYVIWASVAVGLLVTACVAYGWRRGLALWLLASVVPALFALWAIMAINYMQHVHTDPWSDYNHSRNFTGPILNFFLFNNGYHTAHHESAGLHWSQLAQAHARIADNIDPRLNERNAVWFLFRTYVLGTFFARFRTTQIGRAPFDPPDGRSVDLTSEDVPAAEIGTNAPMREPLAVG